MRGNEEIGALLVVSQVISEDQLVEALRAATEKQRSIQRILIDSGTAGKDVICKAIAEDAGVPYVDLSNYLVDPKVVDLVPEEVARRHKLFPLFKIGGTLTVAMADPTDLIGLDQVSLSSNCEVEACVSGERDIDDALSEGYGAARRVQHLLKSIEESRSGGGAAEAAAALGVREAPIARLVDLVLTQAVKDRASDIHIEPEDEALRMRFRIDGVLYDIPAPPKHLESAVISRIKVLSNMDIATTRIPQDGHFQREIDGIPVDVRVSTVPTVNGENLVLRLLMRSDSLLELNDLGFGEQCQEQFESIISRPHGMVLATGPTGSGKTTTLYAAINRVNGVDKNILTIEDPVEYRIPLVRQIQVNPKAGITFANGLRSILRQDPDIVMVGEIRDLETADIAVQAALTGHLVFSTLHTNDAASTLIRLINMGVPPFLLSASIVGVIAQRLVRRLCPKCKKEYKPLPGIIENLGLDGRDVTFCRSKGCRNCKGTGYKGRIGIFEIMKITDEIGELIVRSAPASQIMRMARENGMIPLRDDGIRKALMGETSLEEVARVTQARVDVGRTETGVSGPEDFWVPDQGSTMPEPEPASAEEGPVEIFPSKPVPVQPGGEGKEQVDIGEYQKRIANWLANR